MEHIGTRLRELRPVLGKEHVVGGVDVVQPPVDGIGEDLPQIVVCVYVGVVVHSLKQRPDYFHSAG